MTSTSEKTTKHAATVPLRNAGPEELEKLSREGMLSLTLEEMRAIQAYFKEQDRDPSDIELETLAQTWSEHCVHKTFKGAFEYQEKNLGDTSSVAEGGKARFDNLLKDTVARATHDLNPPWCLSVFKDNAGVIHFDEKDSISFKVETHNHPSALEPYGGAGTGIGGVIRDIMGCGLGGKPVFNTDVFCFGPLDLDKSKLPEGMLHPKRIAQGVVSGVRDYGNRMGIPTGNGAIYFDQGYVGNPLVFCGTIGIMPKSAVEKSVQPGDLVVAAGGRTGRDGIHGATFSSAPLESGITSNVVQIGHSIMEKKILDVLLQARDKNLYRSVTDCGAGGFSSAVGELGQETGVQVWLDKAPLKYQGLSPWEIWVSESQERMVFAVPPEKWNSFRVLFQQEDVEAVVIGEFTNDKKLTLLYGDEVVGEISMAFLHDGVPKLQLKADWDAPAFFKKHQTEPLARAKAEDVGATLKTLLTHPVIASKESVIRQYDHEVQGGAIVKPLMGKDHDGPTDAAVFRPKLEGWKSVAVSNGMNPEVGKRDPYLMAKMAVDEAYRNLIAVGGTLRTVAILDNFCWGDAKDPLELGALVRASLGCRDTALAYKLPFISGKDSFNNTWKTTDGRLMSIPPTLLISAMGVIDDARQCLTPGLKEEGGLLYVVGETQEKLGGSLAAQIWEKNQEPLPTLEFNDSLQLYKKLQTSMKYRALSACHDVSDGGIALTVAEMAFGSGFGAELNLPKEAKNPAAYLFSESPSRFVVEVSAQKQNEFEQTLGQRNAVLIGKVTKDAKLRINYKGKSLVDENVADLKALWKKPLGGL